MVNARLRYFNCVFGAQETQRKVAESVARESSRASAGSRCSDSSNASESILGSSTEQRCSPWSGRVSKQWDGLESGPVDCASCSLAHSCPVVKHRAKRLHRAFIALITVLVVDEKMQKQGQLHNSRATMLGDLLCAAHAVVQCNETKPTDFAPPSVSPASPSTPLVTTGQTSSVRPSASHVPAKSVCAHVMASTSVLRVGQKTALLTTYAKTVQRRVIREVSAAGDPFAAFSALVASASALFADVAKRPDSEDLPSLLADLERSAVSTPSPSHHAAQEASLVRDEVLRLATRVLSPPPADGASKPRPVPRDIEQSASSSGSTPPTASSVPPFPHLHHRSTFSSLTSRPVPIEPTSDTNAVSPEFDSFSSA